MQLGTVEPNMGIGGESDARAEDGVQKVPHTTPGLTVRLLTRRH